MRTPANGSDAATSSQHSNKHCRVATFTAAQNGAAEASDGSAADEGANADVAVAAAPAGAAAASTGTNEQPNHASRSGVLRLICC